jgi:hypothetical protein
MDLARKLGIGIVMIVPTFVIAGLLWDLFGKSWVAVFLWVVIMGALYGAIVTGKLSRSKKTKDLDMERSLHLSESGH